MTATSQPSLLALDGRTGADRVLLGGKAASVERMRRLEIDVPPAFVLTTAVCRRFYDPADGDGSVPSDVWAEVPAAVAELGRVTGRTFGSGDRPLLVSVRSGAAVSMPGMMDTVLNLGMTEAVRDALAAESGDPEYASDVWRRFHEQFEKVVGEPAPADPWAQLRLAVAAVFRSWQSTRARAYRRDRGIPEDGGTAVTVQAMVFGNVDDRSGTGVLFSRDPLGGGAEVYGEWLPRGQGEDVVSGRMDALPLAELAGSMPEVHAALMDATRRLELDGRDVQDIEFTVERGRLWLLQTRAAKRAPESAVRHAVSFVREGLITPAEALDRVTAEQVETLLKPRVDARAARSAAVLATGKPACPGVAVGTVVTDADDAQDQADEGVDVVLARPTTDPDDVPGMSVCTAVVTELGGSTSHAAVVCRELGVPCVVGTGAGTVTSLGGRVVTVDGTAGVIYDGALPTASPASSSDPDLAQLTEWARAETGKDGSLAELLRAR
ncbi:pyruvate, phosphate dikinase [Pseudonocardia eucalypti]|uniref:Pyruvate, phosphate dikinase n=1 Tax=Pseudonocardia eucalypti TaxID=648755 RepID=A0ABP9QU32_9PSEU|nr:pyruvate,orthophosphate dikinase [Pseudonocardia eucalypti]